MSINAMKQALEALELLARYENPETKIQVRKPKDGGPIVTMYPHKVATDAADAIRTAIAEAKKQEPVAWLGLEQSDMPDGDDPMYDHDFFLKGMVWADAILRKKNATPPAAQQEPEFECPRCGHCCARGQA